MVKGETGMRTLKNLSGFILCISIAAVFSGCVTAPEPIMNRSSNASGSLNPGYDVVYYPQVQTDKTWGQVVVDLKQANRGTIWIYTGDDYLAYSRPAVVKHLDFSKKPNGLEIHYQRVGSNDIKAFTLFYYQLMKVSLATQIGRDGRQGRYAIIIPEILTFRATDLTTAERLTDALFFTQQQVKNVMKQYEEQLVRFEPVAAQYRALTVKPAVSEEQRKLFVQANALAQQKEYGKALAQYDKAIELERTAYPEAYFNMALLAAQEHRPVTAIFYMRHYLLLKPDAKDARSAQDKIYEWEMLFQK